MTGSQPADDAQGGDSTSLTAFQIEVARAFFTLDADGFLLAGGAALAAQRMTARPTHP